MEWNGLFSESRQPSADEISQFISSGLWEELNEYLQDGYQVMPKLAYSKCSMQKGWNIKYQKGGKALCTLYPMSGYFIALVVIGEKERGEIEFLLPALSEYTQELIGKTPRTMGAKWLMVDVTDNRILDDVKSLIGIRVKPKRQVHTT